MRSRRNITLCLLSSLHLQFLEKKYFNQKRNDQMKLSKAQDRILANTTRYMYPNVFQDFKYLLIKIHLRTARFKKAKYVLC